MDKHEIFGIISCRNKFRVVSYLWDCKCGHGDCVASLQKTLQLKQSNLSKHLTSLTDVGILSYTTNGRRRHYEINPIFKAKWDPLLRSIFATEPETNCPHCAKHAGAAPCLSDGRSVK